MKLHVLAVALGLSLARPALAEPSTATSSIARSPGAQRGDALTLKAVVARARAASLGVHRADASVRSARVRAERAGRVFAANPELDVGAGARTGGDSPSLELEAGLVQPLAIAGSAARRDAAAAGLRGAEAEVERAADEAAELAARLFFRALHTDALAASADALTRVDAELLAATERRERVGEQSRADVALARVALARAEAAAARARADAAATRAELAITLDLAPGSELVLDGALTLAPLASSDVSAAIERLPAIRALAAERAAAHAEADAARARALPELSIGARYGREEGHDVVLGTLGITLPFFDRGAVEREEAHARATALDTALAQVRRTAARRAESARTRGVTLARALGGLTSAAAALAETEVVLRRAYDRGERSLTELLAVRRELTEAHREALEHQLAIVEAELDHRAALGLVGDLE